MTNENIPNFSNLIVFAVLDLYRAVADLPTDPYHHDLPNTLPSGRRFVLVVYTRKDVFTLLPDDPARMMLELSAIVENGEGCDSVAKFSMYKKELPRSCGV